MNKLPDWGDTLATNHLWRGEHLNSTMVIRTLGERGEGRGGANVLIEFSLKVDTRWRLIYLMSVPFNFQMTNPSMDVKIDKVLFKNTGW